MQLFVCYSSSVNLGSNNLSSHYCSVNGYRIRILKSGNVANSKSFALVCVNEVLFILLQVFTGTDGDRPEVDDILVVLMNGLTLDAAIASEYSEKLKVRGVRIIAVAMGTETESFEDQIELMASGLQDMLKTPFDFLNEVGNYVLSGVCTMVETTSEPGRVNTI